MQGEVGENGENWGKLVEKRKKMVENHEKRWKTGNRVKMGEILGETGRNLEENGGNRGKLGENGQNWGKMGKIRGNLRKVGGNLGENLG